MISIRSQHSRFSLLPHETLLEGLERTGHEVEFQCRGGYCGACRVRLIDGEVQYLDQPLAFIATDEILPCCCVPKSDIHVDCELRFDLQDAFLQNDMFPAQQSLFDEALFAGASPVKKLARRRAVKQQTQASNLSLF
ncbi:class I ribonucleotide reductase maintenance protein YfaE [Methylophilus medardicus]|uniref:2Fe-2S ferredoxin-like protein n=1 Tax=Methylophilus medardicus TaxID=2588534 RepID=A0A5B8CT97_9PROT|nr:class I ribonucleotide reductase maintenance protein YfaE [Methylophilus medardicus]QDC44554.1 2Fe-2S ferredoxin-like protein [Methylophilus medardicus]QDC49561.1 2Fe-2S ferredoxin-like protein [Methylophilus medardicus]QDC53266.1 2Fe-2S ferredoxin-like protein [Methylophilus medardicus]